MKNLKNLKITKGQRVEIPVEHRENDGIIALQLVKISVPYFGLEVGGEYDTRIMEDGSQFIIEGDGFIDAGLQIA